MGGGEERRRGIERRILIFDYTKGRVKGFHFGSLLMHCNATLVHHRLDLIHKGRHGLLAGRV